MHCSMMLTLVMLVYEQFVVKSKKQQQRDKQQSRPTAARERLSGESRIKTTDKWLAFPGIFQNPRLHVLVHTSSRELRVIIQRCHVSFKRCTIPL